jgi:hypothetical protein
MPTIDIDKRYSATISADKVTSRWKATGRIYKDGERTDQTFSVTKNTRQAVMNAASEEARRIVAEMSGEEDD